MIFVVRESREAVMGVRDEKGQVINAERVGAKANPRPASPGEIVELLRSVW